MIVLFCQYYIPKNAARRQEIDLCFQKNIENPLINKIVMYFEKREDMACIPDKKHIEKIYHPDRMNYGFWLRETDKLKPGTLSILVNSDIYLDDTLLKLHGHLEEMRAAKTFLALTRYNPVEGGLQLNDNPHWCQDTWALVKDNQPMPSALYQEASFELGQPGCDNKIAYVMHSYGYSLTNPCGLVRSVHLQADAARSYDSKASKLIGIHAFVHPTEGIVDQAKLDFDLLTRNPQNPVEIRVNNWINERESYVLNAPERIKLEIEQNQVKTEAVQPNFGVIEVAKPAPSAASTESLKTAAFEPAEYNLVKEFSSRYRVYKDRQFYYCYDKYWPFVRKVSLADWSQQQMKDGLEFFGLAFLPVNLANEVLQVAPDFEHAKDWRFWQHPCRTEQDAAEVHKLFPGFFKEGNTVHVYIAVPWATLIDKEVPFAKLQAVLGLVGARIKSAQAIVEAAGGVLKVHSVCQHVFWARLGPHAKAVGITDFYISHKEKGKDTQEGFEGIALHPWSLYAVNYREDDRNINFVYKDIQVRDVFASFTGAYMPHYISNVRQKLQTLSGLPGYHVKIKDQWHFNDVVYKYQVKTDQEYKNADNLKQTVQYNELMSKSVFSLCPSGAGPNSLRFWECLANGSIPVVLADTLEFPNLQALFPQLPLQWQDAVVFHAEKDLQSLDARLRALTQEQLVRMQAAGLAIYKQCESMTCFGEVKRVIRQFKSRLSEEDLKEKILMSLIKRKPEYETKNIALIKSQQLHIDGKNKPEFTGIENLSEIIINLDRQQTIGNLWFDKAEKIYSVNIIGEKNLIDNIIFKIKKIIKYGKYNEIQYAVQNRLSDEKIKILIDQEEDSKYLFMGLRFEFECPNEYCGKKIQIEIEILPDWFKYKIEYYEDQGYLYQLSEKNITRKDNLFDTENIENGKILYLIEENIKKYELKKSEKQLFEKKSFKKINLLEEEIKNGTSMYVHLMNRNENVERNLENWLSQEIDELILLDWSSGEHVSNIRGIFKDSRVRVVRVEGQTKFVRTLAQNLATQMARNNKIFKCDSDVEFKGDFFSNHILNEGEFWVGDWHQGRDYNERHLHGETYYHLNDFYKVSGYDERISGYGHDDTNLKDRMLLAGMIKKVFSYNYLYHQPHSQMKRIENQNMVHPMVKTYQNRIAVNKNRLWSQYENMQKYKIKNVSERIITVELIGTYDSKFSDKYEKEAINVVASWYLNDKEMQEYEEMQKIKKIWEKQVE